MFTAQLGKIKVGGNSVRYLKGVHVEERTTLICSSERSESQWLECAGRQISEFCDNRAVEEQNELLYLYVDSLKTATIYNTEPMKGIILGT